MDELSPPPHLTGTLSPCPEAGPCSLSSRSGANYHLPDDLHAHMVRLSSRRCARSNHNPPRYPLLTAPPPLPRLGDRRRAQGAASGVRLSEDERSSVYGAGPTELRAGADFGIADTCGVSASTLAARPPRPTWSLQRRGPSLCARAGSGVGHGRGELCGWMLCAPGFVRKSHLEAEGFLERSPLGCHAAIATPSRDLSVCLSRPMVPPAWGQGRGQPGSSLVPATARLGARHTASASAASTA